MSLNLEKSYNASSVEQAVADLWAEADVFHSEPDASKKPYVIVIPPPNVTAALHLGHALNNTLQDVLIRWRRMVGDNTVWLPGTDHAGIATQTVVEKRVLAEDGKRRTDFERDEFIAIIQKWKDEYESMITAQLKAMGCSCDWSRQAFTMDEVRAKSVRQAFFQLFKDGLIYRGKRLVNWDPATQTALADDEVEMHEIDGYFWYMKYPIVDENDNETGEFAVVATTRPETMLGDTAVAVNPKDSARAHLIGKKVRLPIANRVIPILGDDYVVIPDPDSDDAKAKYASGFLKVTPAHDPNDWEIGQRHNLDIINILAPDGTVSDQHGWPAEDVARGEAEFLFGMDRYEAREAIVDWFKSNDLLDEVKPYRHAVGHSYRSHVAVEPYLSDQWYVKVTDDRLAGAALRAMAKDQRSESEGCVWKDAGSFDNSRAATPPRKPGSRSDPAIDENKLRFTPARYAKTFQTWHENIRDWCISRQLWWGHRIPVWRRPKMLSEPPANVGEIVEQLRLWQQEGRIVTQYRGEFVPLETVEKSDLDLTAFFYCVHDPDGGDVEIVEYLEGLGLERDPDVLDTWFSSALWPMSTLGWPDDTPELDAWNPSTVLSTAREIITLWVSRMVMFNVYFRGCVPFSDVFIHAMIQDGEGRKMSKSLGNGVDPLDIIHSHGADAMRFTLTAMTTQTQDVRMPVVRDPDTGRNTSPKFDDGRNFTNKLWNAGRFVLGKLENNHRGTETQSEHETLDIADRWILSRLTRVLGEANEALANYQFNVYGRSLYDFIRRDYCDWYLEAIKPIVDNDDQQGASTRAVLGSVLDAALRLLHPTMPYVTEKLFEALNSVQPQRGVDGLDLPVSELCITAAWPKADASLIDGDVEQRFERVREIVTALRNVRSQYGIPPRQRITVRIKAAEQLMSDTDLIATLAIADIAEFGPNVEPSDESATEVIGQIELYIEGLIDIDAERDRLTKRKAELEKNRSALSGRLNNPGYTDKAPAALVQQSRDQLASVEAEIATVEEKLAEL